jgi:iron complex outermembrane receptor protein
MKKLLLIATLSGTSLVAVAQNATVAQSSQSGSDQEGALAAQLKEVVVTGTLIRGAGPTGSQLIAIGTPDIVASGVTTTAGLLETVPEMSTFGATPQGPQVTSATSGATPPSLHSLPPDATLTLVDGHRIVGDQPLATYPDPSSIPPGAIDHVEVVADGASAIYGSDAVAGVINIILKKNYNGAETNVSYGGASGYNTVNAEQVLGKTWEGGSAMGTLNYESNSDLPNSARSFYRNNLVPYGGKNFLTSSCAPANVEIGTAEYSSPNLAPGGLAQCATAQNADIINQNRRYTLVGTVRQEVGSKVLLSLDVKYSDDSEEQAIASNSAAGTITNANPYFVAPAGTNATSENILYNTSQLGAQQDPYTDKSGMIDAGATIDLTGTWSLNTDFDYGWSKSTAVDEGYNSALLTSALASTNPQTALDPFGTLTNPAVASAILDWPTTFDATQKLYQLNATANGSLFTLPGGDVKLAIGADWRRETYAGSNDTGLAADAGYSAANVSTARNIDSGYGEVFVPIVGKNNAVPMVESLNVSVAGRYDHYSDFGSTTNPKYGFTWSPVGGVSVRASYGHSFHAPQLSDLDAVDTRAILASNTGLVPPGSPNLNGIILAGGNANLKPERATTKSIGIDYVPAFLPTFEASLTYFSIQYQDQINTPPLNEQVFINPILAADYVIMNPTASQLANSLAGIRQTWSGALPTIGEILDFRRYNIAATKVGGWDFNFKYNQALPLGTLRLSLGGEDLTQYETQQAPGSAYVDNLTSGQSYINLVAVVPFHLRGTIGWQEGSFNSQIALNYVGKYKFGYVTSTGAAAVQDVDAFPTVDLFGSYELPADFLGGGVDVALNVYNALNENPPLLLEAGGFSAETANPIGRMFQVTLRKQW